jgi:iron-sulfur cluster repair protein YtfE (RIC family)
MLTGAIKERFSRHHDQLLAYMDALEEVVRELSESKDPAESFSQNQPVLNRLFDFLDSWEIQHEMEEERLLLPMLKRELKPELDAAALESMEQISREHAEGQSLVKSLHRKLKDFMETPRDDAPEYYKLSSELNELVWHFRRHVWSENEKILPIADRLIPKAGDRPWTETSKVSHTEPSDE